MMSEEKTTAIELSATEIETIARECSPAELMSLPVLHQTIKIARGLYRMHQILTDEIMDHVFMPLQGTQLGFFVDSENGQPKVYPRAVVREVVIVCMMLGLRPIGGEIGIICGKCYAGKAGLERLVREWPGLTDLIVTPGVPQGTASDLSLVEMTAEWRHNGKPMTLFRGVTKESDGTLRDTRFSIRVNKGMGPDAVIGKATRKLYRAILDMLSGTAYRGLGDADDLDTGNLVVNESLPAPAPPEFDGRRMKLGRATEQSKLTPPAAQREPGEEG